MLKATESNQSSIKSMKTVGGTIELQRINFE